MAREMKDSGIEWIGQIPITWSRCEIKYYCIDIFPGATPQSNNPDYWNGDINWIPSGSCHDCRIDAAPKKITQAGYENSSTKLIPANTALVAMTGATCGNTGYLTIESCANQSVTAFIEDKSRCNSLFLWYVLRAAKEHLLTFQSGGAQGGVNVENCKNLIVPFVPLEEQHRIAAFLDHKCSKIDAMIAETQRTIEEYKKLKQSIITEAVTKGVRGSRPMKNSGVEWIGEIPEDWERIPIKYCVEFQEGPGIMGADFRLEGVPLIRIAGMHGKYVSTEGCNYLDPDTVERKWKHFKLDIGDVVISASASMGESCMVDENAVGCIPYTGLIRFKCREVLSNLYLQYFLSAQVYLEQINVQKTGATIQHYGPTHISRVYIILPSITEQKEIVEHLNIKCGYLDSIIEGEQLLLVELENYKKSVIYEYVTGKKEVN